MITINFIPNTYIRFDKALFEKHFNCISDRNNANCDFVIVNNSVPEWVDPKRCILQMTEPPLLPYWEKNYIEKHKYHTVFTYLPSGPNEFLFNEDPIGYPFTIGSKEITRQNTTIKTRGIFYSGMRGEYEYPKIHKSINAIDIRPLRRHTIEWFLTNTQQIYVYGKGWDKNTRNSKIGWINQKFIDIEENHCDFIIAMENMMIPAYITEKLLQGFMLDRVVLYLGEPNITKYVPSNTFIDLRPYYKNNTLDFPAILNRIQTITQLEYDNILNHAREFRKTLIGKYHKSDIQLSEFMIQRIYK